MKRMIIATIAGAAVITGSIAFAQGSGTDTYKAKCLMCHAADGTGNSPAGKAMKAPPFTDPTIMKMPDRPICSRSSRMEKARCPPITASSQTRNSRT